MSSNQDRTKAKLQQYTNNTIQYNTHVVNGLFQIHNKFDIICNNQNQISTL